MTATAKAGPDQETVMADSKAKYNERLKRVNDTLALEEPDRVPVAPFCGTYPYLHAGFTMADVLYDLEKGKESVREYANDFEPDLMDSYKTSMIGQGPMMEKLGLTWLMWAGQPDANIPENSIHQYIEREYLEEDEYEEFLTDFSGWITRNWFPRGFKALEPWGSVDMRGSLGYGYLPSMMQFADGKLLESVAVMTEVGKMVREYFSEHDSFVNELVDMGFPVATGAVTAVAFDSFSNMLRGTLGVLVDLLEQPENVHAVLEMFYPSTVNCALAQMAHSAGQFVYIPLTKGMDGFMSPSQYDEFYWPTFKRLVEELVEHGQTPWIYTEGKYNTRLERLAELPEGKCLIHFEDVDMVEAKRIVGSRNCISGGFNTRLLESGSVGAVEDEVKRVLDICAPGGGYIFDVNDTLDACKDENVEAMFETVKDYGRY